MADLKNRKCLSKVNKLKNPALAAILFKWRESPWSLVKFQSVEVIDP
jgi:hypothetical protein